MKIPYKTWKYNGGEIGVRLECAETFETGFRIQNSDDLIAMFMAIDAYEMETKKSIVEITIPYLPYARQDRIATKGDPLAIGVLASLIASTGIKIVNTIDVHSEKSIDAFADEGIHLNSISPVKYIQKYLQFIHATSDNVVFIAPDKGAHEKTTRYCDALYVNKAIQCYKQRSPIDGSLMGFFVDGDFSVTPHRLTLSGHEIIHFVIVDDICDGGGTFHGVADAVRKAYEDFKLPYRLHLWTTHGIYSKGIDDLLKKFDTLGCTNSFTNNIKHDRLFTIDI